MEVFPINFPKIDFSRLLNSNNIRVVLFVAVPVVVLLCTAAVLMAAYDPQPSASQTASGDTALAAETPDTPDTADTTYFNDTVDTAGTSSYAVDTTSTEPDLSSDSYTSSAEANFNSDSDTSSDTVAVSSVPVSAMIIVPFYSQEEEMPTGCEIVSARMALAYYGIETDYDELTSYINTDELQYNDEGLLYGASPNAAFIGNPRTSAGMGCFAAVIADMIESMNLDGITTDDTSGLPLDFVAQTYTTQGYPVLVWATMSMTDSTETTTWYLTDEYGNITDEKYTWLANEHCLVLVGYDEDYYYFNDPLADGVVKYEKELAESRYEEIGMYSLVVKSAVGN